MRNLLLGAVLLGTAACGAYAFPGERPSPTPATGTVSGTVVSVPCAPVEQAGQQCAGRPVSGLELDFLCGQSTVTKAITDSKGYYSVQLQPGSCAVKFKTYMRYISGPETLTIRAGNNIVANYVFDNGIRVPQPQQ